MRAHNLSTLQDLSTRQEEELKENTTKGHKQTNNQLES
jgi:hypothetical protein